MSSTSLTTTTPSAAAAATATPTSLSSLCSSCHAAVPRYRCPRCSTRTCSLACSRTHKVRTLCSGVRDPGAYASRTQLNTPAAFDRDFNFISGVERGIERAARESERRGIKVDGASGPQTAGRGRGGGGRGGRGGFKGPQGLSQGGGGSWQNGGRDGERLKRGEVPLMKSLARDGITVLRAPKGMSRETENKTHWRRKGGGVSWTVEWIEIDSPLEGNGKNSRGTSQLYENLSVREGFVGWQTTMRGVKRKREGADPPPVDQGDDKTGEHDDRLLAMEAVGKQTEPTTKVLLPFDTSMRLKDLLRGQTVREFPTIYAWRTGQGPGPGFEFLDKLEVQEESKESETKDPVDADSMADDPENHPGIEKELDDGDCSDEAGDDETVGVESSEVGHLELETDVHVGAESNLGISGAIAAALTADLGEQQPG